VVDVMKPRDTVLDVTVRDDVDEHGRDVIVIDSIYDAGTADRWIFYRALYAMTVCDCNIFFKF